MAVETIGIDLASPKGDKSIKVITKGKKIISIEEISLTRIIPEDYIPWYKMPVKLRGLPYNMRWAALRKHVKQHGHYDWEKTLGLEKDLIATE